MQLLQTKRAIQLLPLWKRSTATTRCRSIRRLSDLEDTGVPHFEDSQDVSRSAAASAGDPAHQQQVDKGSWATRNSLAREEAPSENSQSSEPEGGSYVDTYDGGTNGEKDTLLVEAWADGCGDPRENEGRKEPESAENSHHSTKESRLVTIDENPEPMAADSESEMR
ncbi:conserved hypothetical protein [Neospora caninum Liverpool]|uniref:Uncharacterized protein n=1 Tax=Neospora caninum (strain Liverpool) TaxID=572307 RepID=F0V8Z1_NEOCL|nr:conserved hypothetical protein [Neospora caninum Liverpool]CBZ50182.1 conserved hypothetical protein [Neospora caninum Liverpool]CEL64782.1 TPA: hypothetical protein BN1204_006580 [Neospora caninum Liverpool]|eukprot:XP_003880217.1 conserved hypothetical protein [Neospora caninum Liverpool]